MFERARRRFAPGMVLGQKLAGRGAWEVGADGAWVVLSDGRRLVDFGSYAVTLFGHRHPEVVAAVERQLKELPTSTRVLLNQPTLDLGERLVAALRPSSLDRVWFGLNGCDAVELALKLARAATGRPRVLAVAGAFHGKSLGALAATWHARYREPVASALAPVTHIPAEESAVALHARRGDVAALIFEPIQGEGGIVALPPELLRRWARDAREAGAFVIADEIQVGFGRCGPLSLALDHGVDPDAVLLGKALGGGVMPLSAALCSDRLFEPLLRDPFFHTSVFSGHPLSCAAGVAALELAQRLRPRADELGRQLATRLAGLVGAWPEVFTELRGRGLLWGLECTSPQVAGHVLIELSAEGLLVSPCLGRPEVIRLLPPAVSGTAELEAAFHALERAAATTRAWAAAPQVTSSGSDAGPRTNSDGT